MRNYAWLELDRGVWHFLTHLSAGPEESARRWSDLERALTELIDEGWTIVRPYEVPSRESAEIVCGYGLTRLLV